jgi:SAM-dependent methyltransferase
MRVSILPQYRCTKCGSRALSLSCARNEGQEVLDGSIQCKDCRAWFPIRDGIPRFVDHENYGRSFGFQWTIHQKTQLDSYIGMAISKNRLFKATGWPECLHGQRILEAGSGAGRFTECLIETGAEVFSFDFSVAVDSNSRNNGKSSSLHLFQADLRNIPLPSGSFDKILCLGVLQHTPDPGASFLSLARMVRPGGELVIDIYRKNFLSLLQWKYVLRPVTKGIRRDTLYKVISRGVPLLLPLARLLRKVGGRFGARLLPIVEYSHLGLSAEHNQQWAILDTFDMYSPMYDLPQTSATIVRWFQEAGFQDVCVVPGPNGLIGRGKRPAQRASRSESLGDKTECVESLA